MKSTTMLVCIAGALVLGGIGIKLFVLDEEAAPADEGVSEPEDVPEEIAPTFPGDPIVGEPIETASGL
ncbi:MAG: hypothetical protein IIC46_11060, partial [Planctomycetes bacterium]|nr:hypothetical protein [Planctomycetota bacterium]